MKAVYCIHPRIYIQRLFLRMPQRLQYLGRMSLSIPEFPLHQVTMQTGRGAKETHINSCRLKMSDSSHIGWRETVTTDDGKYQLFVVDTTCEILTP